MSSVSGFRCRQCHAELLAKPSDSNGHVDSGAWAPPVLCHGQPLRRLPADQVFSTAWTRARWASCPHCGYRVQVVVHPAGPLVCAACREALQPPAEAAPRTSTIHAQSLCAPYRRSTPADGGTNADSLDRRG